MTPEALVKTMTPEIYERLKLAVETGKWPDGSVLSEEQRASSLQAVMMYQSLNMKSDQHMTLNSDGEIIHKSRQDFKQELAQQDSIATFKHNDF